jgi:hypothetical protein
MEAEAHKSRSCRAPHFGAWRHGTSVSARRA